MTASNKELAQRAQAIAKGADGLERKAANIAAVALGTTGTVGSARSALADLWQKDLQAAALEIIGRLAASSASDDAPLSCAARRVPGLQPLSQTGHARGAGTGPVSLTNGTARSCARRELGWHASAAAGEPI